MSSDVYESVIERWRSNRQASAETYEWITSQDVAREIARIDLPLSTYTQWYWKIDLHNLLHFLTLRVDAHAQWEMRQFARTIAGMMKRVAPLSFEAWLDYDVGGVALSRMELDALGRLIEVREDRLCGRNLEVDEKAMRSVGLSAREISELLDKLRPKKRVADFDLDMRTARTAEYFESQMQAAADSD